MKWGWSNFLQLCRYTGYWSHSFQLRVGKFRSPYLDKATAATGTALPNPTSVCSIIVRPNNGVAANVWDFESANRMVLVHTIAHWGCTDTVRESTLKVDFWRKILCRTGESNPRQYCAWLFGPTLYKLSYPPISFVLSIWRRPKSALNCVI